jgi:hypothetical protein
MADQSAYKPSSLFSHPNSLSFILEPVTDLSDCQVRLFCQFSFVPQCRVWFFFVCLGKLELDFEGCGGLISEWGGGGGGGCGGGGGGGGVVFLYIPLEMFPVCLC